MLVVVRHRVPGVPLCHSTGRRVRSRLPGPGTDPEFRHLRIHVLPVDRLPWFSRDHGRNHADRHPAAVHQWAFHQGEPLCVRGGCLVLALCRRGLAGPVHICLLVVGGVPNGGRALLPGGGPAGSYGRVSGGAEGLMPWGLIRPAAKPMNSSTNRAMDNTILSVRDFTVRSLLPLSRIRNTSPDAREIRMIASSTTITILNITGPLMVLFSCLLNASISFFDCSRSRYFRPG